MEESRLLGMVFGAQQQAGHQYRVVVGQEEVIGHRVGDRAAELHRRLPSFRAEAVVCQLQLVVLRCGLQRALTPRTLPFADPVPLFGGC